MMKRSLSAESVNLYIARLATWATLFVVASVGAGLLFLAWMGLVGTGAVLLKALADIRVSYAALDQMTTISLAACAGLGLIAFLCMAWGALLRTESARSQRAVQAPRGRLAAPKHQGQIKVWVNKSA